MSRKLSRTFATSCREKSRLFCDTSVGFCRLQTPHRQPRLCLPAAGRLPLLRDHHLAGHRQTGRPDRPVGASARARLSASPGPYPEPAVSGASPGAGPPSGNQHSSRRHGHRPGQRIRVRLELHPRLSPAPRRQPPGAKTTPPLTLAHQLLSTTRHGASPPGAKTTPPLTRATICRPVRPGQLAYLAYLARPECRLLHDTCRFMHDFGAA